MHVFDTRVTFETATAFVHRLFVTLIDPIVGFGGGCLGALTGGGDFRAVTNIRKNGIFYRKDRKDHKE
jgi:hypothetical protein